MNRAFRSTVARIAFLTLLAASAAHARAPDPPGETPGVTLDTSGPAAKVAETPAQRDARMTWWRQAKFGLFIHWGVYAVPAGKYGNRTDYGEWIMNSAKIPVAEYRAFARQFNPVKYDPAAWIRIAKDAGMRYIVITSKHHDGFALYPSDLSDWDVADATPYKKDLLGPLVAAAKREGLCIGFYYSQSQDWNNPGGAKSGFKEGDGWDAAHKGDYDAYLKHLAVPQVRELLTRYPIDILWWDTPMHMDARRAAPFVALMALRPGLITNNRLGGGTGDTATPEQFVPVTGYRRGQVRERCHNEYQRWPKDRPLPHTDPWLVVPELAIEVISKSNPAEEMLDKIQEYFDAGVQLVWVVYPKQRLV